MKYKKTATLVAGALLALGTAATAHAAATPHDQLSTDDVGQLLASTDDVLGALRDGGLSRDDDGSLVKSEPKRTGLSLADMPLGVSTPD